MGPVRDDALRERRTDARQELKIRAFLELFPFYRRDTFRRQKSYLKTERMR